MEILQQGRGTHFDPHLLDAFEGIARGLYDDFAGVDGERPRLELEVITQRYFHGSISEMVAQTDSEAPDRSPFASASILSREAF
jgi:hypothetical protein